MGTMVGKRQSQHVNSVGMSNGQEAYNSYQGQDASMRTSGNHWNSPNQIAANHHESNRTIDHMQATNGIASGGSNNRKL